MFIRLKFVLIGLVVFGSLLTINSLVYAEIETALTPLSMFTHDDCIHCRDEKAFLGKLGKERSDFEVIFYNLAEPENRTLF